MGALLVGASFAKKASLGPWAFPALGIHHMEAHLLAPDQSPIRRPSVALRCAAGFWRTYAVGSRQGIW